MEKTKVTKGTFDEVLGIYDTQGESLYRYWLNNHAEPHIKKWLEMHRWNVDTCNTTEYIEYITKHFIEFVYGSR